MGNNDKGKEKNGAAKEPNSNAEQSPQNPNETSSSKANYSQTIVCDECGVQTECRWFVQCDECDSHTHFACAGIDEIGEEEPWSCRKCVAKADQTKLPSDQSNGKQLNVNTHPSDKSQINVDVGVDATNISQNENAVGSIQNPTDNTQVQSVDRNVLNEIVQKFNQRFGRTETVQSCNQKISSTRVPEPNIWESFLENFGNFSEF